MTAPILRRKESRGTPPGISVLHVTKSLQWAHTDREKIRERLSVYSTLKKKKKAILSHKVSFIQYQSHHSYWSFATV